MRIIYLIFMSQLLCVYTFFASNKYKVLRGHKDRVSCIAYLKDNLIVSGSWDKTVRIWDVSQGNCIAILKGHEGGVCLVGAAYNDEGLFIISRSWDGIIKLWDISSGSCLKSSDLPEEFDSYSLVVPKYGKLDRLELAGNLIVSDHWSGEIKVLDAVSNNLLRQLEGHDLGVSCMVPLERSRGVVVPESKANLIASGSYDNTIRVWDIDSGKCLAVLTGHEDYVLCLLDLGYGLLASGSADSSVKIWDMRTGKHIYTFKGHVDDVVSLVNIGNGMIASGSCDHKIILWNFNIIQC